MKKRGAAKSSSAATLVGIITLMIIFYILFLPPSERAELLGETTPGSGDREIGNGTQPGLPDYIESEIILSKNIGRVDVSLDVLDKNIPNVYVTQRTTAQELARIAPVYVKNGVWDKQSRNVTFTLRDSENTQNAYLSFTSLKRKGILTIRLNGVQIFSYALMRANAEPIKIDEALLQRNNMLEFEVSGVGWQFWRTNEYTIEDIKITGEVVDLSRQRSQNVITLSEGEYANIEKATLRFIPYCPGGRGTGRLTISINNKNVFSGVPTCEDPYFIPIAARTLNVGDNYITFQTSEGSYSIEQIVMEFQSKPTKSIVYYFEMDRRLFEGFEEVVSEARCGEIDGYCPKDCNEDIDKDCCLALAEDNYWCDLETDDADDRCATAIDESKCARCPSGYEDSNGESPEACEGMCGDDKDNLCPAGCSIYYDKDCCFDDNEDNYWCDDVPLTGLNSVCEKSLSPGECDDCFFGYRTKSGSTVACDTGLRPVVVERFDVLKEDYSVILDIEFLDDGSSKRADLNVNGHITRIDQDKAIYSRDISNWVEPDNNYIEIYPLTSLDIVNLVIRFE